MPETLFNTNYLISHTKDVFKKRDLEKISEYENKMAAEFLGTLHPDNIFKKGKPIISSNNQLQDRVGITLGLYRITDLNPRELTGREINKSPGARERYDKTISYSLVPLGNLLPNGELSFENLDTNQTVYNAFPPTYPAFAYYPKQISDAVHIAKTELELPFFNTYCCIDFSNNPVDLGPVYYKGFMQNVINVNPQLDTVQTQ